MSLNDEQRRNSSLEQQLSRAQEQLLIQEQSEQLKEVSAQEQLEQLKEVSAQEQSEQLKEVTAQEQSEQLKEVCTQELSEQHKRYEHHSQLPHYVLFTKGRVQRRSCFSWMDVLTVLMLLLQFTMQLGESGDQPLLPLTSPLYVPKTTLSKYTRLMPRYAS